MAALVVCFVVFLAFMSGLSSATYCVCKDGLSESIYQKDIDYACGAGADCTPISQNGGCFNPNTVKAHCDYAVNSYFQRKGQATGSCDFSGSAIPAQSVPNQSSGCSYPSTATTGGTTTTPTTTPNTGGTTTTSPNTGGTTTTAPGTTNPGMGTGTATPSVFGMGPTGSGITNTDSSDGTKLIIIHQGTLFYSFALVALLLFFSSGFTITTI